MAGEEGRGRSCGSIIGKTNPAPYSEEDGVEKLGESIEMSSLIPDEEPLGRKAEGGGVR